ncbi:MAG: single-stranded DNA-binding protein [Ruminococcaceae bacterium]|nr:single-stranded DNA-binding protein [Oscillospiraceae bacterium]
MNKVILMGRLTRDPELRTTPSGVSTCSFTVAVDRRYKSADGQTQADFISVVAWRQTAEFVSKYFSKGSRILITGSIQTRTWDDQEGKKHYVTEVVAEDVEFCESKRSEGGSSYNGGASQSSASDSGYFAIDDDDSGVPF